MLATDLAGAFFPLNTFAGQPGPVIQGISPPAQGPEAFFGGAQRQPSLRFLFAGSHGGLMRAIALLREPGKFAITWNIGSIFFRLREAIQLCLPGGDIVPQGGGAGDGALFIGTRGGKSLTQGSQLGGGGGQVRIARRQFTPGSFGAGAGIFFSGFRFPERGGCLIGCGGGGIKLLGGLLVGSLAGEGSRGGGLSPGSGAGGDNISGPCHRTGSPGTHELTGGHKIGSEGGAGQELCEEAS